MLQQLLVYTFKVIMCSTMLLLYYYVALRNKKFHSYNRFYLLITVMLSAVLPLINLQWFNVSSHSAQTIHLYGLLNASSGESGSVVANAGVSGQQFLLAGFAIISTVMLITLLIRITKIFSLRKKYPLSKTAAFDFINTNLQQAPFSFLRNIFWRSDISLHSETGKQILQHEIMHIKQRHTWDKLFMQTVLCFFWINPFYWLLKKELYLLHEFIADEKAVENSDASAFAKMLLTAQYGKFTFLPAQSIFYSSVKRRLLMLTTSKKTQLSYLRRIMVLPLLTGVLCLFAFTIKNENISSSTQKIMAATPFKLVVDAGHGGKDNGAFGNNLYEKNSTLKIAEAIKKFSPEYGIDVVLTRDKDVFMSPQEKSDFANGQHADAFVSVHVNSSPNNEPLKSGIEVLLSRKNETNLKTVPF